ncbi:hypothetical protein QTP86_012377 [Hemibagrus guttatus]|nr:hypothetical protein QTP86_012377 [Hemibagrus guttatus]
MIYASTGNMKCFECGDIGHKRLTCPHKGRKEEAVTDTMEENREPVVNQEGTTEHVEVSQTVENAEPAAAEVQSIGDENVESAIPSASGDVTRRSESETMLDMKVKSDLWSEMLHGSDSVVDDALSDQGHIVSTGWAAVRERTRIRSQRLLDQLAAETVGSLPAAYQELLNDPTVIDQWREAGQYEFPSLNISAAVEEWQEDERLILSFTTPELGTLELAGKKALYMLCVKSCFHLDLILPRSRDI